MGEEVQDLRIDQVATATGLTKRTIRYYEEIGLLPEAMRTDGNYRRYGSEDLRRLERITRLKDSVGLSLGDVSKLMGVEDKLDGLRTQFFSEEGRDEKLRTLDGYEALLTEYLGLVDHRIQSLEKERETLLLRFEKVAKRRAELRQP